MEAGHLPLVSDALKTLMVVAPVESEVWTAYSVPWPVSWASQCQEPLGALAGLLIARGRLRPALDFARCQDGVGKGRTPLPGLFMVPSTSPPPPLLPLSPSPLQTGD